MSSDLFVTVVCAAFVALFAAQRYNTPATNRHSTTAHLFFTSGAFYVGASLVLYVVLSQIVLLPGMLPFLGIEDAAKLLQDYVKPPILAAVILTTMLPKVPYLTAVDNVLLGAFQRLGHIPFGVTQLADNLVENRLAPTSADIERARRWIEQEDDVPSDLANRLTADTTSVEGFFTETLMLHLAALSLEKESGYRDFFRRNGPALKALRADFNVFAAQSQAFCVLFDQLTPRAAADASNFALKQARSKYLAIGKVVRSATADLIARAVTAAEPSEGAVVQRLRRLGFATDGLDCPKPPIGAFALMGTAMVLALLGVVVLKPPPAGAGMPGPVVALDIGLTVTAGVLVAILPKLTWASLRRRAEREPPYGAWLMLSAAAGAVAFAIDRGFVAATHHSLARAIDFAAVPLNPSPFIAAALAFAISALCDVAVVTGRFRRLAEAAVAGAACMACIGLCLKLLALPSQTEAVAMWFPFALSFAIGAVPGAIVPHLYRRALNGDGVNLHSGLAPVPA